MILSDTTTLGQSGSGSDGKEGVLRIPQRPSITEASPSDCLVSYPGHSLGESYLFAEMQSVYSATQADWATGALLPLCRDAVSVFCNPSWLGHFYYNPLII